VRRSQTLLSLLLLTALASLALPLQASAGEGDLDASFGVDGKVEVTVANRSLQCLATTDRNEVLVGLSGYGTGTVSQIREFDSRGRLDSDFGDHGILRMPLADGIFDCKGLSDGRIAVLDGRNLRVFLRDGQADSSFGTNGSADPAQSLLGFSAGSMSVDSVGRYYLGGSRATTGKGGVLRLNADGSLDASFGVDGYVEDPGGLDARAVTSVAASRDGGVFAGIARRGGSTDSTDPKNHNFVAKLDARGHPEPGFGSGGVVDAHGPGYANVGISEIAVSGDDGVAVRSDGMYPGSKGPVTVVHSLWQFDASGSPITSPPFVYFFVGASAAAAPDGRIMVVGNDSLPRLLVYATRGAALDPGFDRDGLSTVSFASYAVSQAMTVDASGRVVIASCLGQYCEYGPRSMSLVRFLGPGGGRGVLRARIASPDDSELHGVAGRALSISGVASPLEDVASVRVAIAKYSGKGSKMRCRWVTGVGRALTPARGAKSRSCRKPKFLRASGTGDWSLALTAGLSAGSYRAYARAISKSGKKSDIYQSLEASRNLTVANR
jgi:uncharacterized delta-60 repeat protein